MKNILRAWMILFVAFITVSQLNAEEYKGNKSTKNVALKQTTAGCAPSSAYDWLDINNVRARINTGGDMWWDLPGGTGSKYFIPAASQTTTSMYSGSLWIGGLDINNQLKLAAQKFRQDGIDYWSGPLTVDGTASIDETTCAQYDVFFKISREEVDEFISHCDPIDGHFIPSEDYNIIPAILNWPAHGDVSKGQSYYLAPFYDVLGDGEYDPYSGDYPYYDMSNELCHSDVPTQEEEIDGTVVGSILADQVIKGDQTLWWVFNDKGNIHTETTGSAIGIEVRAQAFAFATNDVINNMTFYSYEVINRSTFELTQTYFSPWVDTDLGFAEDDFVGCDVNRGLGYCYNGKAIDGNGEVQSYGVQPPAIGVDFFQGPYMDADNYDNPAFDSDSIGGASFGGSCDIVTQDGSLRTMSFIRDGQIVSEPTIVRSAAINGVNFGNGIVDDERFGMRRFVYHNNGGNPNQSDPDNAPEYYNYLRGIWKDNTKMYYGGTAHISGDGTVGPECEFMFPFDSDPCNWGTGGLPPNGGYNQNNFYWSEETGAAGSPNPSGDRRFMQSAGPFTLKSGAVNYITVGIPWARATSGGAWASVEKLRIVDDKCQALFDNCFKVIDGPSAPDLSYIELDQKLIVYITNSVTSNNYLEKYAEWDPNIIQPLPGSTTGEESDAWYRFEGYQIFQLKNGDVNVDDIHDPDLARLVAQFDVNNGVTKIVNFDYNDYIGANVPVVEVDGGDNGISHSFEISQDAFATDDVTLINNKTYYFLALAYAHNSYLAYGVNQPNSEGQTHPYLSGRKNIKVYSAMPHLIVNGLVQNSVYGNSPKITRIAGFGNGGMNLDFTDETVEEILSKSPASDENTYGSPDYPIAYNPEYKINAGPLNIKVIDPLSVPSSDFTWWMDTLVRVKLYDVTGDGNVEGDTTSIMIGNWKLEDHITGDVYTSDTTILNEYEQLFIELGFSINVEQPYVAGPITIGKIMAGNPSALKDYSIVLSDNDGMIESTVTYEDSSRIWLSGVADVDQPNYALDWIRAGTYQNPEEGGDPSGDDWNMAAIPNTPWDEDAVYEKIGEGTWAPYCLTAYGTDRMPGENIESTVGTAFSKISKLLSGMENLASVDIVMTPDKDKWTRCPVVEAGFYSELAEGNAERFRKRMAASVDKDGNSAVIGVGPSDNPNDPNYISDMGMGWFPGYAINIETGERLNMMFAEDSYLVDQNGRDMLFNPTKRNLDLSDQAFDENVFKGVGLNRIPIMGGKHYVYIYDHRSTKFLDLYEFDMPAYDAGKTASMYLDSLPKLSTVFAESSFYGLLMYTGIPMGIEGQEWLSNEVKIRIRVSRPYERGYTAMPLDTVYPDMDVNNYYPMYQFTMEGLETEFDVPEKIETDLDAIAIVPNPYYAYSSYETSALDNRIRITNLPEKCTITVYNVSGTKVKQFKKDTPETTIDWGLQNFAAVPIAAGVYYFHIKSDDGERIVKWFCITRVPDLNTF